jgi:hypothetical protein
MYASFLERSYHFPEQFIGQWNWLTDGVELSCPSNGYSVSTPFIMYTHVRFADVLTGIDVFDAGMMVLAVYTLNFVHPGLLTKGTRRKGTDVEMVKASG